MKNSNISFEDSGPLLYVFERAPIRRISAQIILSLLAILCGIAAFQVLFWYASIKYIIAILMFIWLIHCRRKPICYCFDEAMIVVLTPTEISLVFKTWFGVFDYYIVTYEDLVGVSENWSELYIGEKTIGGLSILNVELNELSKKDRQNILKFWEKKIQKLE